MRRMLATIALMVATTALPFAAGCRREPEASPVEPQLTDAQRADPGTAKPKSVVTEASAEQLLSARLPADEAAAGWIRLFDGHTLFGWDIAGSANWRVKDGSIVVDQGEQSLLCTSLPWRDYELVVEFKATGKTNSGVFLRTPLEPQDPAVDCYEVNIAADDHPFPTGSVVNRLKADEPENAQEFDQWRTMKIQLQGGHLQITVDGKLVCDYTDESPLPANRIGLQHNSGRIEFRNIRLRPLGLQSLLDEELSKWTKYPDMPGDFSMTDDRELHVQGGRTQLESKDSYDNFVLLAEYKLAKAEMNSGIFFRCIPGEEMMGYECQLSNEVKDANPLTPADCGTGGIFRRQDARVVAGEVDQWATVVLVAHGESIAAWVNGVQVSNWYDDRSPDENPRKGRRLEAGTIMIQGHDPGTDALLKQFSIVAIE